MSSAGLAPESSPAPTVTTAIPTTTASSLSASSGGGGLSTGAKVAVGVVVPVIVIVAFLAGFVLMRRRKRGANRASEAQKHNQELQADAHHTQEIAKVEKTHNHPAELDSTQLYGAGSDPPNTDSKPPTYH